MNGEITLGVFFTNLLDQTVKMAIWDIDSSDLDTANEIAIILEEQNLPALKEESGMKGYHVWTFFKPVSVKKARDKMKKIVPNMYKRYIQFFPERDKVINDFYFELPIKLPLGVHNITKYRSKFINSKGKSLKPITALTSLEIGEL